VSAIELVSGFRLAHIVNASSLTRIRLEDGSIRAKGSWYAAFEMETAQTEVSFHSCRVERSRMES